MKKALFLASMLIAPLTLPSPAALSAPQPDAEEISDIALEAYIYLYPLVLMDITRRQSTNVLTPSGDRAPMNEFANLRAFPDASFRTVVRPNFDTLYSILWLDLTSEPVVISVPASGDRYYLMPALDMWTDVDSSPGTRTTGNNAGTFAYVQSGWQGELPEGVTKVEVSTPYGWIILRTQTNGVADYENVHRFQDGLKVALLSQYLNPSFNGVQHQGSQQVPVGEIDPTVDMETAPMIQVENMSGREFFEYAAKLMLISKPKISDFSQIARLARINIVAGQELNFDALAPEIQAALKKVPERGLNYIRENATKLGEMHNGWSINRSGMGVYGINYLKRASIAMFGLGANQAADAVYPLLVTDNAGRSIDPSARYRLHFSKEELPPVGAFWSVTLYDSQGFQVANPLNRFAIGDRSDLKFNADGSLDLYFQSESPGSDLESNWLPSPASEEWNLTMRLYAPEREVLDGTWVPPGLQKVE